MLAGLVSVRCNTNDLDEKKQKSHIKKHGVSFEEARTVFYDENAIQFFDPDHSDDEDRFLLLGMSIKPQVLVIALEKQRH